MAQCFIIRFKFCSFGSVLEYTSPYVSPDRKGRHSFAVDNMIWLLFIVLVPFSNSVTGGQYGQFTLAHLIFNLNMLGIAVFISLNWFYAGRKGFIHEKVDPIRITIYKRVYVSFILITLLAIVLSFIIPHWSSLAYILIFPTEYLIGRQMMG